MLFSDIDGVSVFYDLVRVSGKNQKEHDERLRLVLDRIKDAGLTLSIEKCKFNKDRLKFLRFDIDSDGIHVNNEKVKAIIEMPRPKNVKELQSFLGMMNQYSKFIKAYAKKMSPLYELLKKNVIWKCTSKCENAFNVAKNCLKSDDVLTFYDPNLPVKLTVDASPNGIGTVLFHNFSDQSVRPIAFASRVLTPAEKNYSQIDKEALAIIYGVKYFHQYLFGRKFVLETDHKPLVYILAIKRHTYDVC